MIRFIKDPNELYDIELTGKYILRNLNYHWFAFGKAAIVTRRRGTVLDLDREQLEFCSRRGRQVYTGSGKRYPGGRTLISDVAIVCDTPDEVNAIIQIDVDAEREFNDMKERTHAKVLALAGASVPGQDNG